MRNRKTVNFICFLITMNLVGYIFGQNTESMITKEDYITPYNIVDSISFGNTFKNPIIKGAYADPSVCRVGEDYYLVTSSLEYFPSIPIFHSKDLVNWKNIGYCIDRKEQLPMGLNMFAPNIQYHQGLFYVSSTNFSGLGGNFYITAKNPEGPWSDPIWVDIRGIDPNLFFDDDGRTYIITSMFVIHEIDVASGKLLDEGQKIWYGNGGSALEAPHIYKKDGYYYLLAAEGGTLEGHRVTSARAINIVGPYIDNPSNPIVAHENAAGQLNALHAVGHGDIIQAHDASWWMLLHGYRLQGNRGIHHTLGRETCLAPVEWPNHSWPIVNGNGTLSIEMQAPTFLNVQKKQIPFQTEFDTPKLDMGWNYIQLPNDTYYTLNERKGHLRLKGSSLILGEKGSPTFLGRRLQDFDFEATTVMEFEPSAENEEAGITLVNNGTHFDLLVTKKGNEKVVQVKLQFGSTIYHSAFKVLKKGPVDLRIEGDGQTYSFYYRQDGTLFKKLESVEATYLSSETVGGFGGVYIGMYATGNGYQSKTNADFDSFEYVGNDQ